MWPQVEEVRGDRDGNLRALSGRDWDCVVDTSGFVPRIVRQSVELLADRVPHYTFVSTISVYADFKTSPNEMSAVAELPDADSEDVQRNYGPLKAACEHVVQKFLPSSSLVVRPGLIVGPWDPTDRFTYWPRRLARGGDVLVPEPRHLRVQFIDVRDLAEWMVTMAERRVTGVFNATGPVPRPTLEDMLEACRRVGNPGARLRWVDADFLLERGVVEFQDLPLWVVDPEWPGFMDVDVSQAIREGLRFRSVNETVQDTLRWLHDHPDWEPSGRQGVKIPPPGLSEQRESELLAEWEVRA
jgi:2'-hydroxyisoflavone reductase